MVACIYVVAVYSSLYYFEDMTEKSLFYSCTLSVIGLTVTEDEKLAVTEELRI